MPCLRLSLCILILFLSRTASAEKQSSPPNKITIYAFFATWCVPCRVELPHLDELAKRYADQGVRLLLVSEDAPSFAGNIPAFLSGLGVEAPWKRDSDSKLISQYNPAGGLPYTVIVDANDTLLYAHSGYEPGDETLVESALTKALKVDATQTGRRSSVRVNTQGFGAWRRSSFDALNEEAQLNAGAARIEVQGQHENYQASVRVDGAWIKDEITGTDRDARLERAALSIAGDSYDLRLGDSYAAFGNGVALSLRKVDPLGLDTSIQGVHGGIRSHGFDVRALAGVTNPQNLDPLEYAVVSEDRDLITGAEIGVELGEHFRIAPYVLHVSAKEAAADGGDVRWWIGGSSTAFRGRRLTLAFDGAVAKRQGIALVDQTGWAGYGLAQWQPISSLQLLLEAKAYRHWQIGRAERGLLYHEPPTLEREDQEVPSNEDVLGLRSRVEWKPRPSTTLFVNALGYRYTQDQTAPIDGSLALHGYIGANQRFGDNASAALAGGLRQENRSDGSEKLRLWHVDIDLAMRLSRSLSLSMKWNHRQERKEVFNTLNFRRGLATTGLSLKDVGVFSLLYGYSTEELNTPTHYPAVELGAHLPRGGFLRLFAGRLVGGRVCVSGSCRDVAPFEGIRLDFTAAY